MKKISFYYQRSIKYYDFKKILIRTIFVKKSWYFLKIKFSYSVDNIGKILIICESIILNVFLFYYYFNIIYSKTILI